MKSLIFIPVRAGSVGIKNKNLIKINNKPLIKYTLDVAKKIKNADIFVSTDSKKIVNYCQRQGFKIDYLRPKNISKSSTSMIDTVLHGLKFLEKKNLNYENLILLQPTNPLRTVKVLNSAIKKFVISNKPLLATVTRMREHPFECIQLLKHNRWKFLKKKNNQLNRRQLFEKNFFFIDGTIYISKIRFLKKYKNFIIEKKTSLFHLKNNWPIDIDHPDDILVAKNFIR